MVTSAPIRRMPFTIQASELALIQRLSNSEISDSDREALVHIAVRALDSEGKDPRDFLNGCNRDITGRLLAGLAREHELSELAREILPIKRALTATVEVLNVQIRNRLDLRYVPEGVTLTTPGAQERICEAYRELFELIGLELIRNSPIEANVLFRDINAGVYDRILYEKLDEITEWAKRHKINLQK